MVMKKLFSVLAALSILAVSALCFTASAVGTVNMRLSPSKSTLRAGETFTVTLSANGTKAAGGIANAGPLTVGFDTSRLEYVSTSAGAKVKAGDIFANVSAAGELGLDFNPQSAKALKEDGALFVIKFKVKNGVESGSCLLSLAAAPASVANEAGQTLNVNTQGVSLSFAKPLSSENRLKTLVLSNAALSPSFNPSVIRYTVSVPFSVARLIIGASAMDLDATVNVVNRDLTPGEVTQVRVHVKAANGSEKTYTLSVTRAADPNAPTTEEPTSADVTTTEATTVDPSSLTEGMPTTGVPGANTLISIRAGGFPLSPGFSSDQKEYTLWVNHETTDLQISGIPADVTSTVEVAGGTKLLVGRNTATVVCTAADGSKTEYKLSIYRPQPIGEEEKMFQKAVPEKAAGGIKWWLVLLIALLTFAAGGAAGLFLAPQYRARKF